MFRSNLGTDNRLTKKSKMQDHLRFLFVLSNISMSSKYFIDKSSIIYFTQNEFSKILRFFAKRIFNFGFERNSETETLISYIDSWCIFNKKTINDISDLNKEGIKGFLKLTLQEKIVRKRLQTFSIGEKEYYIICSIFVLPYSKSLIENNPNLKIQGYILDTTWKVLPMYVTSIITACFGNTSLPIGFSFSNSETKGNNENVLSVIESQISVDFSSTIIESDQGKALIVLCQKRSITHLKCIRQLLVGLKYDEYAYEVGQLIQCSCELDFVNMADFFAIKFTEIFQKNSESLIQINKSLKKIGLVFEFKNVTEDDPGPINKISIENESRWREVSKWRRIDFKMPSTTNSLEAMHGHMNHNIPRRNNFFSSIFKST